MIYASDPLICPIALFIQRFTGVKLVYHEHDSPDSEDKEEGIGDRGKENDQNGIFQRIIMGSRRAVARMAEVCVLPNEERVEIFKRQTGTTRPVECAWNVPGINEIGPQKKKPDPKEPLKLFYGGSLSPERLPLVLVEEIVGVQGAIQLEIVGYPTYSAKDYMQTVNRLEQSSRPKVITYHGVLAERKDLLQIADQCGAALCLMPMKGGDLNMRTMAGASNKPFDAMARGLAVVVSDLEEWKSLYLPGKKLERGDGYWISDMGYGIAINPESRESIRAGLEWMLNNREKIWEMGERGRQKIQKEWNYEGKNKQVFRRIEAN